MNHSALLTKYPQLLRFAVNLMKENVYYPKHVLQLLNNYFNFDKLIIFPFAYSAIDIEKRSRREVLSNFVVLNIPDTSIKEYRDRIYKIDIFALKNLPAQVRERNVLFQRDLLTTEKAKTSDYVHNMAKLGLSKQACIYLRTNNELLGTLCVFRGDDKPDFSEEERCLMEYLSELISAQYVVSQRLTRDALSQEGFNMFFQNAKIGAMMLNSRLAVLTANEKALESSKTFLEIFHKSHSYFGRSNTHHNGRFSNVQAMIDWIGLDLIQEIGPVRFSNVAHQFYFYCWPLIFINVLGDVETRHLILITENQHLDQVEMEGIYDALTQRESDVLRLVSEGYKNEQIAEKIHVSIYTVRTHISNIYRKFSVNSRLELLMKINKKDGNNI